MGQIIPVVKMKKSLKYQIINQVKTFGRAQTCVVVG